MIWSSPRWWAPSIELSVQSRPAFLIEIALFGILMTTIFFALLNTHSFLVKGDPGSDSSEPEVLKPSQGDSAGAAGDGVRDSVRDGQPHLGTDTDDDLPDGPIIFVSCAACQRKLSQRQVPRGPCRGRLSGVMGFDDVFVVDAEDEGNLKDVEYRNADPITTTRPLQNPGEDDGLEGQGRVEDVSSASTGSFSEGNMRGSMVEYVATRYRTFKRAALAGKLPVADPSAASSLLSDSDLVVILSNALRKKD